MLIQASTDSILRPRFGRSTDDYFPFIEDISNIIDILNQPEPPSNSETVSILAAENISKYDIVASTGLRVTSDNANQRGQVVGIAFEDIKVGYQGLIVNFGEFQNSLWNWNRGDKIYVNKYILSKTAPISGFSQIVGNAISSDSIIIDIQLSILL